jgi:hypothetical protein
MYQPGFAVYITLGSTAKTNSFRKMRKQHLVPLLLAVVASVAAVAYYKWEQWFILPELRQPIVLLLRDPESALFRNEVRNGDILCGQINARNSTGGYVGFRRFFVAGSEYGIDGEDLVGSIASEKETSEMIANLDTKLALMRSLGRKPSQEELSAAVFARFWKKWCEAR